MTTLLAPAVKGAYRLTKKQFAVMCALFVDQVNQLLFGGAAGGGKSGLLRALAFHCAMRWPGAHIAIFRDNYTQLRKTQVQAWHREMAALGYVIKEHWHETLAEWHFPNGSVIEFLHLDQSIGADKWLSAEWAMLLVDEATQLPEDDLATLYSRVRVTEDQQREWRELADVREAEARQAGIKNPTDIAFARSDWHTMAVYASNPGGVSHKFFKEQFVDAARTQSAAMTPWDSVLRVELPGKGEVDLAVRRLFVQSFLTDNPHINPLQYAAGLAHLPLRRREQLLSGNWDFFDGKVFDMLDPLVHLIDARAPFGGRAAPPADWPRIAGLDHGTQSPTAAEWLTRDEDGFIIAGYLEYYAAGPNRQHIEAIRALASLDGRLDITFEADPQMYRKRQGHERLWSVADEFTYGGEPPEDSYDAQLARQQGIRLHQSQAERTASRMALERMFEPDPDLVFPDWHPLRGQHGAPRMFICKQAQHLWTELQGIKFQDGGKEETVKEDDHAYDALYRAATVFERALAAQRRTQTSRMVVGYAS